MNRHQFMAQGKIKPKAIKKPIAKKKKIKRNIKSDSIANRRMRSAAVIYGDRVELGGEDIVIFRERMLAVGREMAAARAMATRRSINQILPPATVCFTGAGPMPRTELRNEIEMAGYTYTNNVIRADVLLFNPQEAGTTTKIDQARGRDIPMIAYNDFLRRIL